MHNRDERDPDLLQRQLEEVRLLSRPAEGLQLKVVCQ